MRPTSPERLRVIEPSPAPLGLESLRHRINSHSIHSVGQFLQLIDQLKSDAMVSQKPSQ